jgi:hypothetical protein
MRIDKFETNGKPDGPFCCLVTGIEVILGEFGGYGLMQQTDPPWPLWVSAGTFEAYRDFCERNGNDRGNGPFQWNAISLPRYMGGTGKLPEKVGERLSITEDDLSRLNTELEARYRP